MFKDVMLDLETMGTRPDAPIVAIGAVSFDMKTLTLGECYYTTVDLQSTIDLGARIDPSTVLWWLKQSEDARNAVCRGNQMPIDLALADLTNFLHYKCAAKNAVRIWGCGADFDNVILAEHYKRAGADLPWEFWNSMCFRTVKNLYPNVEPNKRTGIHHNALDDAIYQAEHLIKIRHTLQGVSA